MKKLNDIQYYTGCLLQRGMTDPETVFKIACEFSKYYKTHIEPGLSNPPHGTHGTHDKHGTNGTQVIKKTSIEKGGLRGKKLVDKKSLQSIDTNCLKELQIKFPHLDVNIEFETFKDWLSAKGKRWKNFRSAFRNWLRRADKYAPKQPIQETERNRVNEKKDFLENWDKKKEEAASMDDIRSILGNNLPKRMVD